MREIISIPPAAPPRTGLHALLYFIPGNPGYIDYYDDFLTALRSDLTWAEGEIAFHIYGRSLDGFADDTHEPFGEHNPPYDLEAQIVSTAKHVSLLRIAPDGEGDRAGQPFDVVILMGHSVGAYIALEVFHRHLRDPSAAPHLKLQSGILLFPTVTHIAKSPSGKRLELIRTTPFLDRNAHRVAQAFLNLWPAWALRWFVSSILRFEAKAAAVTTDFLKARDAVWQAIHMGKDEMRTIAEDEWDDELWEVAREAEAHGVEAPKFFFFFGKDDHWVGDHFRDKFIAAREANVRKGVTRIEIDEGRLPHGFCVTEANSVLVAKRVEVWIREITDGLRPLPATEGRKSREPSSRVASGKKEAALKAKAT